MAPWGLIPRAVRAGRPGGPWRLLLLRAALLLLCLLPGCVVADYTSDLVDPETGRTPVVTWPARFGWGLGFVVGVPLSVAGAPVSYAVYRFTPEPGPSYLFYLLFPSLVTSQGGTLLLGAPFDLLEFLAYRWWSGGEGGRAEPPTPESDPKQERVPGES